MSRVAAVIVLASVSAGTAWADIAFDGVSNSGAQTVASFAWSHTIANNASGLVVVGAEIRGDATGAVIGVSATYADLPVTQIRIDRNGQSTDGAVTWLGYLVAPPQGVAQVKITLTGTFDQAIGMAISLTGVDPSNQPEASNGLTCSGTCTSLDTSLSGLTAGSWMVDVIRLGSSPINVGPTGSNPTQTERTGATTPNTQLRASAEGPLTADGGYVEGWSWTNSALNGSLTAAAFRALSLPPDGGSPKLGWSVGCDSTRAGLSPAILTLLLLVFTIRLTTSARRPGQLKQRPQESASHGKRDRPPRLPE
jgi:hypothetical protein